MTQCEKVIDYMKRNGSITSAQAYQDLGIMRLASRISDIERSGVAIDRETETGKNRFGERTHFTRYSIRGSE